MHRSIGFALLLGCGASSPAPNAEMPPEPARVQWRDVTTEVELSKLAAEAYAGGRGLMLDVRADWCIPCLELERKTFTDSGVVDLLGRTFVVVRLDVTDPSPDADALQQRVHGTTLPWVMLWPMTSEEAKAFASGEVPPPAKTVSTFVSAQELLPLLNASAG